VFAAYLDRFGDSELWFQAQFGVGYARENRGQQDSAMEAYRKVIDRHSGPTAARAQFQIGECLFAQKKHSGAVRELLKVDILYGYPEWSAAALYEAGRCFEELKQPEQARAQFTQVKEKYPDSEWAKLATQRLASNTDAPPVGGQ
jgi:TolA-binding protein